MKRPVRGRIGKIHEERTVLLGIFPDLGSSPVGKCLSDIISLRYFLDRYLTFNQAERIKIIHHSIYNTVMTVKSPVDRIVAQVRISIIEYLMVQPVPLVLAQRGLGHMPFPHHAGTVAGLFENFSNGHRVP